MVLEKMAKKWQWWDSDYRRCTGKSPQIAAASMDAPKAKSMRLRFKGDKLKDKKKTSRNRHARNDKKAATSSAQGSGTAIDLDTAPPDGNEQAWVAVEHVTDLAGPALFYQLDIPIHNHHSSSSNTAASAICIALNSTRNCVEPQALTSTSAVSLDDAQLATLDVDGATVVASQDADNAHPQAFADVTPSDTMQVWVTTRILDTPSTSPRYTLRSAEGRFLTAERNASISAYTEARGPLEEWSLVSLESTESKGGARPSVFALRGANGQLLGVDRVAGGKKVLRCDVLFPAAEKSSRVTAADVDPSAHWHCRVQWKYRNEARKRELKEAPLLARDSAFAGAKRVRV